MALILPYSGVVFVLLNMPLSPTNSILSSSLTASQIQAIKSNDS